MLKVNFGGYMAIMRGYVNVDIVADPQVEIVSDVRVAHGHFEDNSIDLAYYSHVLEHLYTNEVEDCLRNIYPKMKEDGIVRISVPDLRKIGPMIPLSGPEFNYIGVIFGGDQNMRTDSRDNDNNRHKSGWTEELLIEVLKSCGYRSVRKWDPGEIEDLRGFATAPFAWFSTNIEGSR